MYRFNDKQRRRLLEDALVEFLLDAPAHAGAGRSEPKTAPASAGAAVAKR